MNLVITGPAAPPGSVPKPAPFSNNRPSAQGIIVLGTVCPDPRDTIVNIKGNDISNHREGVVLLSAQCVNVHRNVIHDHNSDPVECSGILLRNSDFNSIGHNDIFANGENLGADGGILMYNSHNNVVQSNDVTGNFGAGISLRFLSAGNQVVNNQVSGHTLFGGDLSELVLAGVNNYENNCYTTTNISPAPPLAKKCPKPPASVGA